ncbi:MAG: D-alanyl-D-alanine carboxypeptidase family protein [Ruminococcus sp.]|nr:D-alanyl-D-alanine carboxypeptidase family protein [Ruminococcus sp.]
MKKKCEKLIALITALCCIACTTACGREIPSVNDTDTNFVVTGGETINTAEGEDGESIKLVPRTTAAQEFSETTDTETVTSGSNVSLVTRSKEELDRINSNKKPAKKPSSGSGTGTGKGNGSKATTTITTTTTTTTTTTITVTTTAKSAPTIQLSYTSAEIIVGQTKKYALVTGYYDEVWTSDNENIATVDQYGNITGTGEGKCKIRVTDRNTKEYGEIAVTVKKPQGIQQIDGITYADGVLIANKSYALPSTYNPGGLTTETYNAFQSLVQAAANDGYSLRNASGFRSYETQEQIYNNYVYTHGQATADTFSARPGHSEHQTGMAIDVNNPSDSFNGTPEALWLKEHCHEYGFIIRYPEGKQHITGYKYESWHIRYVGVEMAKKLRDAGIAKGDANITLEEYFGIDSIYR